MPKRGTHGLGCAVLAKPRFPLLLPEKVFRVVLAHTKAAKNSAGHEQGVPRPFPAALAELRHEVLFRYHRSNRATS